MRLLHRTKGLNTKRYVSDYEMTEFDDAILATPDQTAELLKRIADGECKKKEPNKPEHQEIIPGVYCPRLFPSRQPLNCIGVSCGHFHRGAGKCAELVRAEVAYRQENVP